MKPTKYRAVATVVDGIRFASKKEARRDAELQLLVRAKEITDLKRQPRFPLVVNGEKICDYVADWSYTEKRRHAFFYGAAKEKTYAIVEDAKGVQTPAFKLKWKLAKALYPAISEWRLS